ncbi:hypothetical protein GGS21DRAFT_549002 [Xylaria nigripes]|nr:hypothetical protein GGS21DRAFT_549002 [Xylaria nigripes]
MVGTTKYTEEQIHFILDRTVKVVPRGETARVHDQAVKEYRERFGDEDFGVNQVRYVTERYGGDPLYGNRWANMIKGTGKFSTTSLPRGSQTPSQTPSPSNMTPSAKRVLQDGSQSKNVICSHCSGLGVVPSNRSQDSRPSSGQHGTAKQPETEEKKVIDNSSYRPQSYRPTPDYQSPAEQDLIPSYLQQPFDSTRQPIQTVYSQSHGFPLDLEPSTATGNANVVNRGSELALSSEAESDFVSEQPKTTMNQRITREGQSRHSRLPSITYPTTASISTLETDGTISGPANDNNNFSFSWEASNLAPRYSTTMASATSSNAAYAQMPFTTQLQAPNTAGMSGLEMMPLDHTRTASGTPLYTHLGKRGRSASTGHTLIPVENAPLPSVIPNTPYEWQTGANAMQQSSLYAGDMSATSPSATTPMPYGSEYLGMSTTTDPTTAQATAIYGAEQAEEQERRPAQRARIEAEQTDTTWEAEQSLDDI